MPKRAKELGPQAVKNLAEPGMHAVGGVAGLHLQITSETAKSWVLRTMVGEKRRDIGLGSYPEIGLAKAREDAVKAKDKIREGIDPILAKKAAKRALIESQALRVTFRDAAIRYQSVTADEWKNAKHRQQWKATLETYSYPVIGNMPVADIRKDHILSILQPHWKTKTETMDRTRQRIEKILDWCEAAGYRNGPNPAAWNKSWKLLLGNGNKVKHLAAVPIDEIGTFAAELRTHQGMSAKCLEFVILTTCRSGEARLATWSEIDEAKALWTIPAERMKMGREHRVPLSDAALELLKSLPRDGELLFSGPGGKPLSDMALTVLMRKMGRKEVPHGMRSCFRSWAGERTTFESDVIEMCLAHVVGSKVQKAYMRSDVLTKRARLMQAWANFVSKASAPSNVISLQRAS